MTIEITVQRQRANDYYDTGWCVFIEGKPGTKVYCYTLDKDGTCEVAFAEDSEADMNRLARLLAFACLEGCELDIPSGERVLRKRLLAPPPALLTKEEGDQLKRENQNLHRRFDKYLRKDR